MKFSNFLFPESKTPANDYDVIEESLREAELSEKLGYDVIWLAEHYFDGGCAYVDPTTFAAAIAARTTNIKIGFAVAQMALHHPIRFAEQIALVDNISKGRMIVGVGRGTAYNFYEFRGFGINPDEAHDMLLEVEDILVESWTTNNYKHNGKYWQVELPVLRPQVFQKPHPPMIRACSGLESTLEMAREGRPFMMNVQSNETTVERLRQYQATMSEAGVAKLKPAFRPGEAGTVTAASSSALTDGASAVLVMSEAKAQRLGYSTSITVKSYAKAAIEPYPQLLLAPAIAIPKALAKAGLALEDIDVFEIHEAFAAQVLATLNALESPAFARDFLGRADGKPFGTIPRSKINPNGGSIALGHPFAATGGRLVTSLSNELRRTGKRYGLISVCAAGGIGGVMILENRDHA